jgi:hypothetical protein
MPLEVEIGNLCHRSIGRMPSDRSLLSLDASLAIPTRVLSYGPPWAYYLGGYQDRLLGGPLGLPGLCHTAPDGVRRKDYGAEVLG